MKTVQLKMNRLWWRISWYFILVHVCNSLSQDRCPADFVQCNNGRCISARLECDGDADCQDLSDELYCRATCSHTEFTCKNYRCISSRWLCDNENDCGDNSDETENCPSTKCLDSQFYCKNGKCIPNSWQCDKEDDCGDNSDEAEHCPVITCSEKEFTCNNRRCIPNIWRCDNNNDCGDYSDETENCSLRTCSDKEFTCKNHKCIPRRWQCDTKNDCGDNSDESENCSLRTCSDKEFTCKNLKCIPSKWQCDKENDCGDNSDESENCSSKICSDIEFTCKNQKCIPRRWQCDNENDCGDNSDEDESCLIDECSNNNGGCSQNCVKTGMSFYCTCNTGYYLVGNFSCEDIDECETLGSCSQICKNTMGGFNCSCIKGYQIDPKQPRFCKAVGQEASILLANSRDIREIQLTSFDFREVVSNLERAVALDYLYKEDIIIWSDVMLRRIFSASFYKSNTSYVEIIKENVSTPDGLAVDWVYNHIYWTDAGKNTIEVADLKGKFRKTLIRTDLDEPRTIVVDPRYGWMYWTDWGNPPKIEKAGQDGTYRKIIVLKDIIWPNGLAIDYVLNRLYWADAKLHTIATCDFEGSNRQIILSSFKYLMHVFSIAVFEDSLFWTDWHTNAIYSTNKFYGNNVSTITEIGLKPMNIQVYHELKYPNSTNYCGLQNGGCSHLCLPAPQINKTSAKYKCACPDGWAFLIDDLKCHLLT